MPWVRPTARGWLFGFAGAFWFLVGLVNRMAFPFLLACAALALTAASFIAAALSMRKVMVRRPPAGDGVTGQTVSMPLTVTNLLRRRRQALAVIEVTPFAPDPISSTLVAPLGPGEERLIDRRVLALRRGEFDIDRITLRSGDPAGLFHRERTVHLPGKLLIVPGTESLANINLAGQNTVPAITGSPVNASGISQEFFGIRRYNPSDGLRRIHWKSSAKAGRLMVLEFEHLAVISAAIIVDADHTQISGPEPWSNLECHVRAAASLVSHFAGMYCQLAFGCGGDRKLVVPLRPAAQLERDLLVALARLTPGTVPVTDIIFEMADILPRGTVVFCLTLSTTPAIVDAVNALCRQGMTVRWICARKAVFAIGDSRSDDRDLLPRRALVPVTEVSPGMRLDAVLSQLG